MSVKAAVHSADPISVTLAAGSVADLAGNALATSTTHIQSVDTAAPGSPTLALAD